MTPFRPEYEYFLAIADSKSISQAAERIGVRQASLSLSLQKLELQIGEKLFSRSRSGVHLTKAGEQHYQIMKRLKTEWDMLIRSGRTNSGGIIRIGAHQVVAQTTFASFLPKILEKHSNLFVEIELDRSATITRKVLFSEVDVGLVINPHRHPDLVIVPLRKEFIGLYKSKFLSEEPNQLYYNPEMIAVTTSLKSFHFRRHVAISDYSTVLSFVLNRGGAGLLPSDLAKGQSDLQLLKSILPSQLCLIYRKDRSNNTYLQDTILEIKKLKK